MTGSQPPKLRAVLIAAITASVVMVAYGLGYRVLAARLNAPLDATPVSQEALDELPMEIGDWTGQEVPVDAEIVRATDTDAHVSRRYTKKGGFESVSLWIAAGVRARDLMPHRPEVCYTGAGWTLVNRRLTELFLSEETELPCNIMRFSRGALNTEHVMVLDYYLVDEEYCADVSSLRSRAWRGSGAVGYVAQVQIVVAVPSPAAVEAAQRIVSDFAVASAPAIVQLFHRDVDDPISDGP